MKNLIAVASVALSLGAWADDSYLYWMVEKTVTRDGESFSDFTNAKIGYLDASGNMSYLGLYGEGASGDLISIKSATPGFESWADMAGMGSGSTFYIELFNDNVWVARSEGLDYSALESFINGMLNTPTLPWTTATTTFSGNVPEPSSALLLLLGCAGLALKRKKQANA